MIEQGYPELSVRRQCELIGLNRSSLYYQPVGESPYNLQLMRLLDEQCNWPQKLDHVLR